jgi:tRNA (guanine-N7-)-methyltransferase
VINANDWTVKNLDFIMIIDIILIGDLMRLRNVKNKEEIMNNCPILIRNSEEYLSKWKSLFNNSNPIYVEIGMGKGDFIIENAIRYPNINFIGIEKYSSVLARAIEKLNDKDLPNLRLIRMDANFIEEVFSHEVNVIYLNFSDPWPKKRTAKRRLTSDLFLEKYKSIFKKDHTIIMKTDNMHLFEYSLESLSRNGYILDKVSLDLHNSDIDNNIETEYERKFVLKGNNIYYVYAKKLV